MLDKLKRGYYEFKEHKFNKELAEYLADNGQHPQTMFITCSDSRVVPNQITNAKPGELFITRNIGNFVPPYLGENSRFLATASALEYSVVNLKVKNIIVCGHSQCGAIASLYKDLTPNENNIHIVKWLELGKDAKDKAIKTLPNASMQELREFTEKESVKLQLENLMTYPPVREKVESGELKIYGWYYNFRSGEVFCYDKEKDEFVPLLQFEEE